MKTKSRYKRALRRWFPKRYIHMMLRRTEIEYRDKLKTVKSSADRQELAADHHFEMSDWEQWLASIEDEKLIKEAARMDLSLDDIPMFVSLGKKTGHWDAEIRDRVLYDDTRRALQKAIRERAPAYRKEKRERQEFYLKVVLGVMTAVTGLGGTIIGIIAFLKK
jgi:hypothetical protein